MQIRAILPRIAVSAILFMAVPAVASAQMALDISVGFGPPAIPVYDQPPCPEQNDIWAPGYWAYGEYGYYWVPGTWVAAPEVGYLWTPGYWGYSGNAYGWNQGYWATQVGFYGGINYGAGYYGSGYSGGRWSGNNFQYDTAVTVVNTTSIHNTYRTDVVDRGGSRTGYNGGAGGIQVRPTSSEEAVAKLRHVAMEPSQRTNEASAGENRAYLDKVNGGKPGAAAVARPLTATNRPTGFTPITAADKKPATAEEPKAVDKPKAMEPKDMEMPKVSAPKAAAPRAVEKPKAVAPRAMQKPKAVAPRMLAKPKAPAPRQAAPQRRAVPQRQAAPQHKPGPSHPEEKPHN